MSPGVYQFLDSSGDILYVGKAKLLKDRIKSYFVKELGRGLAIDLMVKGSKDIKFFETESEIEAVLLEAELIKQIKPKYNIKLKDDKSFLVLKITKEDFPCISFVRYKDTDLSDKSAQYFGPYPSGELLKRSLNILRKVFPFRDCSQSKLRTYEKKGRPCIYGDIGICPSPCVDKVSKAEYQKNIWFLIQFLKGKKKKIYSELTREMKVASRQRKFEEAMGARNKLVALDHIKEIAIGLKDDFANGAACLFDRIECFDIANIMGQYGVGAMAVFVQGKKSTDDYRKFKIKFDQGINDLKMMEEMMTRRFDNDWPKPDLIVVDGGASQLKVGKEVLAKFKLDIPIVSIAKGEKRNKNGFHFGDNKVAKYIKGNIGLEHILIGCRDEAHRFAISYYRLLHKKGMLNA